MKSFRLIPIALLLAVAAPAQASTAPSVVTVRPNGHFGPLVLYDLETLRPDLRLPSGLRSADGQTFLAARATGSGTVLTRHVLPSGRIASRGVLPSRYGLAALSGDGKRAVLVDARPTPGRTRLAIVGTTRWTVLRRLDLRGSYGVEAVSPDGRRLFLIRYGNGGYNLRLYDLRTNRLAFTPLVEGAAGFRKMVGAAWTSVATRDGGWLLTLYIKPNGGGFIHALDLRRAFGHCVDLPAGFVDASSIRTASLALSPDERRLYIAGPLAGRMLVVDLAGPRIARIVRFRSAERSGTRDIVGAATVSPREDTVAFAVDGKVWRYRLATDQVDAPVRVGRVAALAFTANGRRLVVVRRDSPALVLR
jgi:hypothetical protein